MDAGSLSKATLSAQEYAETKKVADKINSTLNNGKGYKMIMGQEEFLRLMTEEMKYQDPTQPLKDRDFIAQMAQISQLDQVSAMKNEITSMNKEIGNVSRLIEKNNALSLLGKVVDIVEGSGVISGTVEEIVGGDYPQLLVNGKYYDYQNVNKLRNK